MIQVSRTGNARKLSQTSEMSCKTQNKRECFSNRFVNSWNNIPDEVVLAKTINMFKNGVDSALSRTSANIPMDWEANGCKKWLKRIVHLRMPLFRYHATTVKRLR